MTNQTLSPSRFLNISQMADLLQISVPTLHKYKKAGKLPYFQAFRTVLFDAEKVLAALEVTPKTGKK